MSRQALWALMKSRRCWTSPVQFAVLAVIADAMNEDGDPKRGIPAGFAWPSKTTIAARLGMSARYVVTVIHELERLGVLEVRKSAGPRGAHLYRLRLATGAAQFTGEAVDQGRAVHPSGDSTGAVPFIPQARPVNGSDVNGEQDGAPGVNGSTPAPGAPGSSELLTELSTEQLRERREREERLHQTRKTITDAGRQLLAETWFGTKADLEAALKELYPDAEALALDVAVSHLWLGVQCGALRRAPRPQIHAAAL